jgi:aquaporin Z
MNLPKPQPAQPRRSKFRSPVEALRADWPLYVFEAAELAAFMISACAVTVLLFDPAVTPVKNPWFARSLMGLAMGLTAVLIIKSPWGRRSGAHFNPAITFTFYRLGKIGPYDAVFYIVSHFAGAIAGVGIAALALGPRLAIPQVDYAVTIPGVGGVAGAFAAETFMAALLMAVVLVTSNQRRLAPYTTYLVGFLIANYILFLAPVSGFSINPARTVGSAVFAHVWTALWLYFAAPLLGMMSAAEAYTRIENSPATQPGIRHYFTHRHLIQRNVLPDERPTRAAGGPPPF